METIFQEIYFIIYSQIFQNVKVMMENHFLILGVSHSLNLLFQIQFLNLQFSNLSISISFISILWHPYFLKLFTLILFLFLFSYLLNLFLKWMIIFQRDMIFTILHLYFSMIFRILNLFNYFRLQLFIYLLFIYLELVLIVQDFIIYNFNLFYQFLVLFLQFY